MAVSGSDVYAAGAEFSGPPNTGATLVAKVWKNGVATALTDGTAQAEAYSVLVSSH